MNSNIAIVRELPTAAPDQQVIDSLEALLKLAKDGELRGLLWHGMLRDGSYLLEGVGRYSSLEQVIGAIEMLKHEILTSKAPPEKMTVEIPDPPQNQ